MSFLGFLEFSRERAHFEHFGGLGPDMARMCIRKFILTTLAAWAQIWLAWASEALVEHFGGLICFLEFS